MLHNKLTKTLSEVKSDFVDKHNKPDFFLDFIDVLKLGKLHAVLSNVKEKGINPLRVPLIRKALALMILEFQRRCFFQTAIVQWTIERA